MKTIILISCCKTKLNHKAPAEQLYQSAGFKKQLAFAKSIRHDAIFVISAKHHLVPLSMELEPYDVCLNDKSSEEKKSWAKIVLKQLSENYSLSEDEFIILAGKDYYSELIKGISNYKLPLEGLPMGTRLQWLDEHTNSGTSENACLKIHKWVNTLPRLSWPFDVCDIPSNGVYLFFEKGEKYFGFDRIVRIGTHTGNNNLVKRLEEHLVKENKDRSIFRKNVGRALLNKENDPFIEKWNWDQTTPGNRSKYKWTLGDEMKQSDIEFSVSKYMRNNLSFVCIPIDSKEERLAYEAYLIRTLSAEPTFKPSENWLGNYSPVDKIRNSGLWLVNELAKHKSESVKVSKYKPLFEFLKNNGSDRITMTFEKINALLNPDSLPSSAYTNRTWWANSKTHLQASAWMTAGFKTTDFTVSSITFIRK